MKVGLLIYGSLEKISGGFLYDRMLVDHLTRHGDSVQVIGLPWRDYAKHLQDNFSQALLGRLARLDCDVLLQDELNHPSLFWLNRRLRRSVDFPIVSIVHHLRSSELRPAWQNWLYRLVERAYLKSVDGYIFNSRTTSQVVAQVGGQKLADRPAVIAYPAGNRLEPAIIAEEILQRAESQGPLKLIFLGNVEPRKGLHTLLDALEIHSMDDLELSVVGSLQANSAYAQAMQLRVVDAGLTHKVMFFGAVDGPSLAGILRGSHAMVVPSSYEGFGIVYLEGMGFGLPALGSLSGAASEIITPGVDGFLVQPGDVQALADCLRIWLSDRRQLGKMGVAAQQRYAAHPTWEQTAETIRNFLVTLLNTGNSG